MESEIEDTEMSYKLREKLSTSLIIFLLLDAKMQHLDEW